MRGTNVLLEESNATIYPNKRVGLIGRNGCGKSTLFALFKGELQPENGSISIPKNWVISSVSQETPGLEESAIDYVLDGDKKYRELEKQLDIATQKNDGLLLAKIHEELELVIAFTI